jgi:Flp pilus assembly CpaE family ATPase
MGGIYLKIKLAILDGDANYLNRIASAFHGKLQDSVEIYSFTNLDDALGSAKSTRIDVLLADSSFEVDAEALPKNCGFAYLTDSPNVSSYNGQRAVFKFQKIDSIHNFVMDAYAERGAAEVGAPSGEALPLYAFTSASGGVGTSVAAVSCAAKFAERGKPTIYLNFERFGNPALYLSGSDNFTMSDVIFAVKSKRPNLAIKLKSNVQRDASGVYWFPAPKNPLDLREINGDDVAALLSALGQTGLFERVVADADFSVDDAALALFQAAAVIIFVSDGSETAGEKLNRALDTLATLEREKEINVTARAALLYNKFSNKSDARADTRGLRAIGGIPKYERATLRQIMAQIMKLEVFSAL